MELFKNLKILIVDDMFVMRKIMKNTLSALNITNTLEAANGKLAIDLLRLETAKGVPFDIVISDWNMPVMTGIELLQYCRSNKFLSNIGFVMVTAELEASQEALAQNDGVDLYIKKPINDANFHEILTFVCKKRSILK